MRRSEAVKMRQIIEQAAQSLTDELALDTVCLHPLWASGAGYEAGFKVRYSNVLYKCLTAHTAQDDWTPDVAHSLWAQIREAHRGVSGDPIPYDGNMALTTGLYYAQEGVVYRCIRDTGTPVYACLADLVGLYVEKQ